MWLIALKRLWHRPWLTALSILSIALAVGLMNSIPLFARAVSFGLLKEELTELSSQLDRPLFSMHVYVHPAGTSLSLQQCATLGQHVQETIVSEVGLPLRQYTWHVESRGLVLRPGAQSAQYGSARKIIAAFELPENQLLLVSSNGNLEISNIGLRYVPDPKGDYPRKAQHYTLRKGLRHYITLHDRAWLPENGVPKMTVVLKPKKF